MTSEPSGSGGKCWVVKENLWGRVGSMEMSTLGQDDAGGKGDNIKNTTTTTTTNNNNNNNNNNNKNNKL